jgi:hypothetical protein
MEFTHHRICQHLVSQTSCNKLPCGLQYLGEWQVLPAEWVIVRVMVLAQDPVCVRVMLDDQRALTTGMFPWYLAFTLGELLGVIFCAAGSMP